MLQYTTVFCFGLYYHGVGIWMGSIVKISISVFVCLTLVVSFGDFSSGSGRGANRESPSLAQNGMILQCLQRARYEVQVILGVPYSASC